MQICVTRPQCVNQSPYLSSFCVRLSDQSPYLYSLDVYSVASSPYMSTTHSSVLLCYTFPIIVSISLFFLMDKTYVNNGARSLSYCWYLHSSFFLSYTLYHLYLLAHSSILKLRAASFFEVLVHIDQTVRHHITKNCNLIFGGGSHSGVIEEGLYCLTLKMSALQSFYMSGTACPMTQCHIPEDLILWYFVLVLQLQGNERAYSAE